MIAPTPAPELAFGLIAWLEQTRIALPLKLVECRFRVDGPFAHVEIDQVFRQTHSRPLDCRYTFPLPDAAAVHRCEMHVNERIVRARVEELEKAREQFAQAKESGYRAALVETERPNLFTLQLGNLQPDDLVIIRLAYVQTLERIAGELRLRLPLTPGVRYIPGRPLLRSNRGPGLVDFSEAPMEAEKLRRDPNFRAIERLGVAGGTELVPAAEHLFQVLARHSKGRRCNFIVLTDGQVGNEAQVLELFAGQTEVVVHTVGIDDAVNDSLLRRLARRHRGECWLVTPNEDITGVVSALGARLGRPIVADLKLCGGKWQTVDPKMPLPDLYAGQTREILLAAPAGTKPPSLSAAGGVTLQPVVSKTANEAVRLAWIRARIEELEAAHDRPAALQLAIAHNVLCEGAAFIAWDEAEKVRVATEEIYQPSMVMEEADLCRTGGTVGAMAVFPRMASPAPMAPPPPPSVRPMAPVAPILHAPPGGAPMEQSRKRTGVFRQLANKVAQAASAFGSGGKLAMSESVADEGFAEPADDLIALSTAPDAPQRLSAWLAEAGLDPAAAEVLAPAVLEWLRADAALVSERRARLRDWREALRHAENKLALCLDFVRVDLSGVAAAAEARKQLMALRRAA